MITRVNKEYSDYKKISQYSVLLSTHVQNDPPLQPMSASMTKVMLGTHRHSLYQKGKVVGGSSALQDWTGKV